MGNDEKVVKVPSSLVEAILAHPGNRAVLAELRELAENSVPEKFSTHRQIKKEAKLAKGE